MKDGWIHELGPSEWSSPGASLDSEVFWKTFRDCSDKLPKNVAAVFNLREMDGIESKEICALLHISESNLWVMLHRARMALRRCLDTNWFGKQGIRMKLRRIKPVRIPPTPDERESRKRIPPGCV